MNDGSVRTNLPILFIALCATLLTGLAVWQSSSNTALVAKDSLGIFAWAIPFAYPILALIFTSRKRMNKPVIAGIVFLIYALSAFMLFVPSLPNIQWHYPLGLLWLAYVFGFID